MKIKTFLKDFLADLEYEVHKLGKRQHALTYPRSVDWLQYSFHASTLLITIRKLNPKLEATSENLAPLKDFLALRWSLLSAYQNHIFLGSDLFLQLATLLAKIIPITRMQLLMPTIQTSYNDITCTDLNDPELKLHHFILSNNHNNIIEVFDCLQLAEGDGILKHPLIFKGIRRQAGVAKDTRRLLPNEQKRLLKHSPEALNYYAAITKLFKIKTQGQSIGAHINRLVKALRESSMQYKGTDFDAHEVAAIGIDAFAIFLDKLDADELSYLFELRAYDRLDMESFESAWQRIIDPVINPANDQLYERHCTGLISDIFELILNTHTELYNMFAKNHSAAVCEYSRAEADIQTARNALRDKLKLPTDYRQCHLSFISKTNLLVAILAQVIKNNNRYFLDIFKDALANSNRLSSDLLHCVSRLNLQTGEQVDKLKLLFPNRHAEVENIIALCNLKDKPRAATVKHVSFFANSKPDADKEPLSYKEVLVQGLKRGRAMG